MKNLICLLSLAATCVAVADTTVTAAVSQPDPAKIELTYRLAGDAAVITANIETNNGQNVWAPMDDSFTTNLMGDVNMKLTANDNASAALPYRVYLNLAEALPGVLLAPGSVRINLEVWKLDALPTFMAVSLVDSGTIKFYRSAAALPGGITDKRYKGDWILMRKIPAAGVVWTMGDGGDQETSAMKSTPHKVTLTDDYYLAVYETTYRQYELIYKALGSPSALTPDTCWGKETAVASGESRDFMPVGSVSWEDLRGVHGMNGVVWCSTNQSSTVYSGSVFNRLRRCTGLMKCDLPTEAQWEYACHAGTATTYHTGNDPELAGWTEDYPTTIEGKAQKHEVGKRTPNAFDLYDMHGNVSEWCLDIFMNDLGSAAVVNPYGAESGGQRSIRGGCFDWPIYKYARSATHYRANSTGRYSCIGFRLAMPAQLDN